MNISIRVPCPHCKTPLSGEIKRIKMDKLDEGDFEVRELTICPNTMCGRTVFTIDSGLHLEPGIYKRGA